VVENVSALADLHKELGVIQERSLYGELTGLEAEMLGEASRLSQGLRIRLSASGNPTPEASLTPEERERPCRDCGRLWSI